LIKNIFKKYLTFGGIYSNLNFRAKYNGVLAKLKKTKVFSRIYWANAFFYLILGRKDEY